MDTVKIVVRPDGRLDRKSAAAYIGISPKTLANMQTRGLGPRSTLVGGRRYYKLDDVIGYVTGERFRRDTFATSSEYDRTVA